MRNLNHFFYTPGEGFNCRSRLDINHDNHEHFESCWNISGDFGDMRFIKTEIRPGFDIWINDCLFRKNIHISLANHPASFSFNFCLSGKTIAKYGKTQEPIEVSSGAQGVFYYPDPNGTTCMSMGVPQRQVSIAISPERLRSYFESDLHAMPPLLRDIMEEKQSRLFCLQRRITPGVGASLQQLLNCPFGGVTRKLFLESRALELIAYQLNPFLENPPGNTSVSRRIHPIDRKHTQLARDLLLSKIDNPPGLGQLAREVGMSHTKLNRCFRKIYGTTVFQYLRNERLSLARQMLDSGLNVTETAYAVGYESISHFSQAFKKQFGIVPSSYTDGL